MAAQKYVPWFLVIVIICPRKCMLSSIYTNSITNISNLAYGQRTFQHIVLPPKYKWAHCVKTMAIRKSRIHFGQAVELTSRWAYQVFVLALR